MGWPQLWGIIRQEQAHLLSQGNNKILRTPTHISSSEEILPASLVAPLPNSEQINQLYLNHTYTKSTQHYINHHYVRFVTPTWYIQLHPNTHYIVNPGFVDRPVWVTALLTTWTEILACETQVERWGSSH